MTMTKTKIVPDENIARLTAHLHKQIDYWVRATDSGASPQSLVLQHGRPYGVAPAPKGLRRRGARRRCFHNAMMLALASEDHTLHRFRGFDAKLYAGGLVYVEGFAAYESLEPPVHHAWAADAEGRVIDPTWGYQSFGVYFGIPIIPKHIRAVLRQGFTRNLLGFPGQFNPDLHVLPATEWVHRSAYPTCGDATRSGEAPV